jgi:uncharacterized protein YbjT (DUF2867 family)
MSVMIIGGTGTVGSATTNRLIDAGYHVKVMTRSVDKFDDLPENAAGVVGNMQIPETLEDAMEGVERLFLITPVAEDESEQGINAVNAAKEADVQRIVYMSVPMPEESLVIPHFASKVPIIDAIKSTGIDYTILEPNNFMQNDFWFMQVIKEYGIYPQPIGSKGMNRVDIRDIADAAANALIQNGHSGRHYPLHGPDSLTGEDVAKVYSEVFGKEIKYGGDDLDAWAEANKEFMPPSMIEDMVIMYTFFQKYGFNASIEDFEKQEKVLGHAPRNFKDFVSELAG